MNDKVELEDVARKEAYMENEIVELRSRVKTLEFDCAELTKHNMELFERVNKLASRQPAWPTGYRPAGRKEWPSDRAGRPTPHLRANRNTKF